MTAFPFLMAAIEAMEPATRKAVAKALLQTLEPDVDWDEFWSTTDPANS